MRREGNKSSTIVQASTLVLFRFSYRQKRRRLCHRRGLLILGLRHLLDIALLRGEQGIPHNREEKVK